MSIYKVPEGVLNILEKLRSHFFGGTDSAGWKMACIKWDLALADKGGLRIGNLSVFNYSLLVLLNMQLTYILQ